MAEWPENICLLQSAIGDVVCLDLLTIINLAFLAIFSLGVVAGICALLIWQKRKDEPQDKKRSNESGSIFFTLFAGVVMVGVLASSMNLVMRGPVSTMSAVTKRTIAENNMIASAKLSVMAATNQPGGGDCDADDMVEPVAWSASGTGSAPSGGGFLPATLGASLTDPWGNSYGYCVWDHGTEIQTDCPTPMLRLKGTAAADGPAIVILSSGPDRAFQTTCADAPDYFIKPGGSDDLVMGQTYFEANASSGGLWNIKGSNPAIAEIDKDIEVKNSGGAVVFGVDSITDASKPSIKVDYIKALSNAKIEAVTKFLGSNGIEGSTSSTPGKAVYGVATAATGSTYGVHGQSDSTTGWGVYGESTTVTGAGYGVVGIVNNGDATGVYGFNPSGAGHAIGVEGRSAGASGGKGVMGRATATTGANFGVVGQSASTDGRGVYGAATATTGANFGVQGQSFSPAGYGGHFSNVAAGGGWGLFSSNDVGIAEDMYLNWGTTRGSAGYGVRDNNGVIQVKNDGGTWAAPGGGGGSLPNCDDGDLLVASGGDWICSGAQLADAFNFTDNSSASLNTVTSSNIIQITGLAAGVPTPITISGDGSPQYRICGNVTCLTEIQTWGSSLSTILNSQYVQVRLTSAGTSVVLRSATLTIGGVSDQWDVTTADCPAVGDTCQDGSKYAGLTPDGNVRMYAAAADLAGTFRWSTGNTVDTAVVACQLNTETGCRTGAANTAILAPLSNADSPYAAAIACDSLDVHGRQDWYLPANNELTTIWPNRVVLGFVNNQYYWSSSESTWTSFARAIYFGGTMNQTDAARASLYRVRCVRK